MGGHGSSRVTPHSGVLATQACPGRKEPHNGHAPLVRLDSHMLTTVVLSQPRVYTDLGQGTSGCWLGCQLFPGRAQTRAQSLVISVALGPKWSTCSPMRPVPGPEPASPGGVGEGQGTRLSGHPLPVPMRPGCPGTPAFLSSGHQGMTSKSEPGPQADGPGATAAVGVPRALTSACPRPPASASPSSLPALNWTRPRVRDPCADPDLGGRTP